MKYMKKEDLVIGTNYECDARNFTIGKWDGEAFEYTRHKFGGTFTDIEYHYDDKGTVKPYMEV